MVTGWLLWCYGSCFVMTMVFDVLEITEIPLNVRFDDHTPAEMRTEGKSCSHMPIITHLSMLRENGLANWKNIGWIVLGHGKEVRLG
jgi:hypothetical protein